jgi:hypothetical protein
MNMANKTRQKKTTKAQKYQLTNDCPNHDKHLCHVVALRNMKAAGQLAKDAKYLCVVCGRAARKKINLCVPVEI